MTDNAVYPVIFLTYLQQVLPVLETGVLRMVVLVALNLALTYMNYRGLHVVGNAAVAMTVFTLAPFVLMCLLGECQGKGGRANAPFDLTPHPAGGHFMVCDSQWGVPILNSPMLWCLQGSLTCSCPI